MLVKVLLYVQKTIISNSLKKILYLLFLSSLLSSCFVNNYQQNIEHEFNKYFLQDDKESYFEEKDLKLLENSNEQTFLPILYEILENKRKKQNTRSLKFSDHSDNAEYDISRIQIELVDFFHKNDENKMWVIKIIKEINLQCDFEYCKMMLPGMYKNYYDLITKNWNVIDRHLLNEFILSIPDIKLALLGTYKIMQIFNAKIDYKLFWETYTTINENNFEKLILKPKLLPYLTSEQRKGYINSIKFYFKLLELIN